MTNPTIFIAILVMYRNVSGLLLNICFCYKCPLKTYKVHCTFPQTNIIDLHDFKAPQESITQLHSCTLITADGQK